MSRKGADNLKKEEDLLKTSQTRLSEINVVYLHIHRHRVHSARLICSFGIFGTTGQGSFTMYFIVKERLSSRTEYTE